MIDEICRTGAQRMLLAALEAEVQDYVQGLASELDDEGRRLVVRNGHAPSRVVRTSSGALELSVPRVNDKRLDPALAPGSASRAPSCRRGIGSPRRWPRCCRCYLHGLSSGDFVPALEQFLGSAAGLSASAITRLTTVWQNEHCDLLSVRPGSRRTSVARRDRRQARLQPSAISGGTRRRSARPPPARGPGPRRRVSRPASSWRAGGWTLAGLEDVGDLVHPVALCPGLWPYVSQRRPEPKGSVTNGDRRRSHATPAQIAKQCPPALGRLPIAIGDGHELLGAVEAHADHHESAGASSWRTLKWMPSTQT